MRENEVIKLSGDIEIKRIDDRHISIHAKNNRGSTVYIIRSISGISSSADDDTTVEIIGDGGQIGTLILAED